MRDDNEILSTFAKRLKETREAKGLSQRELCNALGFSNSIIAKYEQGKTDPSASNVYKIANYLRVDPGWLMAWDVTPPSKKDLSEDAIREAFVEHGVLKPGEPITPELLEAAMSVSKSIAENLRKLRDK